MAVSLVKCLTFNIDGIESRLIPLFMDNQGLQTDCWPPKYLKLHHMLASIGFIFTIVVPIMFPVTGKSVSDIDRTASPVKSKMAAMIAEEFVQLQLQIMQNLKNAIFRLV